MKLLSSSTLSEEEEVLQTSFHATESYIAVALSDRSIHVLSTNGTHLQTFTDPYRPVWALVICSDAILIGSVDGVLRAYNVSSGSLLHTVTGPPSCICALVIPSSSAPLSVLAATDDGCIRLWDLHANICVRTFADGHSSSVFDMQLCGDALLSASYEGITCVWELHSGRRVHTLGPGKGTLHALAVGMGRVVTGYRDGKVRVWDLGDGSELAVLEAHDRVVNGLRFHGDLLISTGTDGWVKVWSVDSYQLIRSVKLYDHAVVTRDMLGGIIVTGGKDGGGDEDVCGLDSRVRAWTVDQEGDGSVQEVGTPAVMVWDVACIQHKVIVSACRRGRPTVEIWDFEPEDSN